MVESYDKQMCLMIGTVSHVSDVAHRHPVAKYFLVTVCSIFFFTTLEKVVRKQGKVDILQQRLKI